MTLQLTPNAGRNSAPVQALFSAQTATGANIRQVVDSILQDAERSKPGNTNAVSGSENTAEKLIIDEIFFSGLANYRSGSVLNWLSAEYQLAHVTSLTAEGTLYNKTACRILAEISPVLDQYAYALNSSD